MSSNRNVLNGVKVLGAIRSREQHEILSEQALEFVVKLHRAFNPTRKHLLQKRVEREQRLLNGQEIPDFLESTKHIRQDKTWKGPKLAPGLVDRRVEITGPTDRKMVINALNSGASCFMADFEDSNSPTWENSIDGQVNMRDGILRTISFTSPEGKTYSLRNDSRIATLLVRPRGWHLEEAHLMIDNEPCSASIFDFGLYFFHNAWNSLKAGQGPYFYLPKMESHLEARLWNDIFNMAQDMMQIPRGTIRATVLIETILAVFEMDEIIYELRDHSAGLNCGRWDYIFSFIKKFRLNREFTLPDRIDVTMTSPFMDAYVRLLIQTCHKRDVHAMGGMAAQIPIKDNKKKNEEAMQKVSQDKLREVKAGHDGTWVAHPALIPIAMNIFNEHMPHPNQLYVNRECGERPITSKDLLNPKINGAKITEQGLRSNIVVALKYMESWLRGVGCVPINHLMEDAATAEISRTQLWFWVKHECSLDSNKKITKEYAIELLKEEAEKIRQQLGPQKYQNSRFELAKKYLATQITGDHYADFLTSLLYPEIASVQIQKSNINLPSNL